MLVTHLFQLAAEVAMEPPAEPGRRGPAGRARVGDRRVPAARPGRRRARPVRRLPGDRRASRRTRRTDTFVAARLWVDNDRWRGVPFLLRTGKRLAAEPPAGQPAPARTRRARSGAAAGRQRRLASPSTARRAGPDAWWSRSRAPASAWSTRDATSTLAAPRRRRPLPPYVRLIHDVLLGDRSLFTRPDGLAHVWRSPTPLLDHRPEVLPYEQVRGARPRRPTWSPRTAGCWASNQEAASRLPGLRGDQGFDEGGYREHERVRAAAGP